jgi:hypothetical protein
MQTLNCLCPAHIPIAFPTTAAGAELLDDVNESIGQPIALELPQMANMQLHASLPATTLLLPMQRAYNHHITSNKYIFF